MDENVGRDRLARGLFELSDREAMWDRREDYRKGRQDLPFAPEGVNKEYLALREQSLANFLDLAMTTPIQRLRAEGFRTGRKDEDADQAAWDEVWQPNKLDARQRITYTQMMTHGRGLMSVWPNVTNPRSPVIRPENGRRVYLSKDPEDPFVSAWAIKVFVVEAPPASLLILPESLQRRGVDVAIVYDRDSWLRFERRAGIEGATALTTSGWEVKDGGGHSLGDVPFVAFDSQQDADGDPAASIEPLMPAQDAINTIRFNTLLAMQFSAFRQRVFTGYDPVVYDANGDPVVMKDANGEPLLDTNGLEIPVTGTPGRVGVDRALVFPGEATKVFDLAESNLDNYVTVLGDFLSQFFAVSQIPPQYLLTRMANLSGDALAGAESSLASLVVDLQTSMGESLEQVMRLANRARGETQDDVASYVIWADAEARSFAQTVDAITKLVSVGFPTRAGFEMIPGATLQKVNRWIELRQDEADTSDLTMATRALVTPTIATAPDTSAASGT